MYDETDIVPLDEALPEIIMLTVDEDEKLAENDPHVKVVQPKQVRLCLQTVVQREAEITADIYKASTLQRANVKFWEVYAGAGLLSREL